jgi:hypothetical protein
MGVAVLEGGNMNVITYTAFKGREEGGARWVGEGEGAVCTPISMQVAMCRWHNVASKEVNV